MTLRRATAADRDTIRAHLERHIAGSMFPLANLDRHGIDGTVPRGLRTWIGEGGIVAVTNEGMLMPQWPETPDWAGFAQVCPGPLIGAAGPADQVRNCLAALGLTDAPTRHSADEPHFDLPLAELQIPDSKGTHLTTIGDADRDLLVPWRAAYHVETLGTAPKDAVDRAEQDIAAYIAQASHRILWHDGQAVSMTGFNATVPGAVQIGGVYTPPELRGRGYARRAVALHLAEVRELGIATRAILFAANTAAARAYIAIGFRQIGTFALVLFDGQQEPIITEICHD